MKRGFIKLNGKAYIIDLQEYRKRDITDFSPRVSVPEGPLYSELGLYQPMPMTDWRGGFGFPWQGVTGNGYLTTYGEIDTRHDGMIIRHTKFTALADTAAEFRKGFMIYGGDVFSWGSCGVGKYNATCDAFEDAAVPDSAAAGINTMWTNGKYLFAAVDNGPIRYASSLAATSDYAASDWTNTGADTTKSIDYNWIHHHNGYAYCGKDADSSGLLGNEIYYANDIDLGDLYGMASDDPDVLICGMDGYETISAHSFHTDLMMTRPDGVYKMEPDKSACKTALDYKDIIDTDNFKGCCVFNENLIYSIQGDLVYQWNGFAVSNITPRALGDTWPYMMYGDYGSFVPMGKWMYALAKTNETYPDMDLICFDGVSWTKLATIYAGSADNATGVSQSAMNYDPLNNRLWMSYQSSAYVTGYIPCSTRSQFPYADFTTDGDHYLETSKIHAGFSFNKKSTPSIYLQADNLSCDAYVEIYYKTDTDTTWKPWGGSSGITNIMESDGIVELKNPLGHDNKTLAYYYMQYRIYLRTNTSDQTPRVTALIPRVLMRPKTLWGWDINVVAESKGTHGQNIDSRSAYKVEEDLKTDRDSVQPLEFEDIYGDKYYVNLTAVTSVAAEFHGDEGPQPDIEQRINISLVQLG